MLKMTKNTKKTKGAFTLVEIIIAIGIIITLAALSINSLIRCKITAYETAAIKGLKTAQTAFEYYRLVNTAYPTTFTQLCNVNPPYLDSRWQGSSSTNSPIEGYNFLIDNLGNDHYEITAWPDRTLHLISSGSIRKFYIDQDGEITAVLSGGGGAGTLKSCTIDPDTGECIQ